MAIHELPRGVRVARRQHVDQRGMFLDRAGRRLPVVKKNRKRGFRRQLLDEGLEEPIFPERSQERMKLGDELDEPAAVARRLSLDLPLDMGPERADVMRGAVAADIADDLGFDQPARRIGLLHFAQARGPRRTRRGSVGE